MLKTLKKYAENKLSQIQFQLTEIELPNQNINLRNKFT